MDKPELNKTRLGRILARTRGFFLVLVVLFSQLVPNLLVIPAAYFIQANAEFTPKQFTQAGLFTLGTILLGNIILLLWVYLSNPQARVRLDGLLGGTHPSVLSNEGEIQAWKQITSCAWRYGIAAGIVSIFIDILPIVGFMLLVMKATTSQIFYILMGGVASASIVIALGVLLIDRLLTPARAILLPKEYENQLSGSGGARMLTKIQVVVFFLILISILLVAPVGYHSIRTVLITGVIGTQGAVRNLQNQSMIAAFIALVLGFGLSFLLSRSVSDPIHQIIAVLDKVEKGDVKQRVGVSATDEVGELAIHFNRMISRLNHLQETLESEVAKRTEQLKATFEVSSVANTILDPDELIAKVVNLITDRFGYYYSAIFLVDESGQWAVLKDATGTAGQTLKTRQHRLPLGGRSMVSTAISTRQARIALDVGQEPVRFENPLLPDTRSEIALPLMVVGRIVGVLDVQSRQEAAFSEQDIGTLQSMANNVATALENARLFRETQKSLEELRISQREYVESAWSETVRENIEYDYASPESTPTEKEPSILDIPLTLREQIIGQLHFEGQQDWTLEERTLVESVATQAALAMENARLLEESHQTALRERMTAEITGKVWSSPNAEFILQTAIKELGKALHADDATIELKIE